MAQSPEDPTEEEEFSPAAGATQQTSGSSASGTSAEQRLPTSDVQLPQAPPALDGGALPGIQAFASLGSIAPFMTLWQLYATHHYPDEADLIGKYHCFTHDHKWVVRWCFLMDFLIRLVLVLLVLVVILRGLSLWPESFNGGQYTAPELPLTDTTP